MEKNNATETVEELNKGIILIVILLGLFFGYYAGKSWNAKKLAAVKNTAPIVSEEKDTAKVSEIKPAEIKTPKAITVSSQKAGGVVSVEKIILPKDGWAAVRDDVSGEMGNILGAVWLPKGESSDVSIELLRRTVSGQKYFLVIYADNGDKKFSTKSDTMTADASGKAVSEIFTAK